MIDVLQIGISEWNSNCTFANAFDLSTTDITTFIDLIDFDCIVLPYDEYLVADAFNNKFNVLVICSRMQAIYLQELIWEMEIRYEVQQYGVMP